MTTTDNKTKKLFMRVLAVLMCAACLITSFSSFFITIADDSSSISSVAITFTQGTTGENTNLSFFSSTPTATVYTNASGCLVVPETYFDIYNETAKDGELAISISYSTTDNDTKDKILDCETFYFDETITDTSWAYSFTGWHIKGATTYIPEQTVFQPGDVITPDILKTYATDSNNDGTYELELEALWGKCYFIQNAYTSMGYAQNSDGYYELDTTSSSGVTGADDKYDGNDPKYPQATIDGLYSTLRGVSTTNHDAYSVVIMLTGDLDYYKDSTITTKESTANQYRYYKYYGFGIDSNYAANATDPTVYVSATYKSLQATRIYTAATNVGDDPTISIEHSLSTKGTKYNYNYKPHGYTNYLYGNLRFDNILFKRIASDTFGSQEIGTQFQLYYPDGDSGVHYFETTARYNVYYNDNNVLTYVSRSTDTAIATLYAHNHEYIVLNGGDFAYCSYNYTTASTIAQRYWYLGRLAEITGYITGGTTATGQSNCTTSTGKLTITVTGGSFASITTSSGSPYAISVGDRVVNVYGDGSEHITTKSSIDVYEYNPYVADLYGGGRTSPLYGDIELNINGCTNIVNVYGGGFNFSAITYGDVTLTIKNSEISGNIYGGGEYANVEKVPSTYTQYSYTSSTLSSTTPSVSSLDSTACNISISGRIGEGGDVKVNISATTVGAEDTEGVGTVYGSGMGQTQTLEARGTGTPIYDLTLNKGAATEGEYSSADYPSGWETEPTYLTYDSTTGYVLIGAYKNISWSSSNSTAVYFYVYNTYAYLSLATVQNVEINITDKSTIYGNVYGGGSIAQVLGNTKVNITDSEVRGTVYGGGDGATIPDGVALYALKGEDYVAPRYEITAVNANGTVTAVTFTDNYSSITAAVNAKALIEISTKYTWSNSADLLAKGGIDNDNYLIYSENMSGLGDVLGSTSVTISGNSNVVDVYGGGNEGAVSGSSTVTIKGGTISGTVYGGGLSASVGSSSVIIEGGTIKGSVYGGGYEGAVTGSSTVTISGGTITGSVYGGGYSASVGSASLSVSGGTFIDNTFYGGGNAGAVLGNITVNITGGTIGTLYGGCNEAAVSGTITLSVADGTVTTVYGGNNADGEISGAIGVTVSQSSGTTTITTLYGGGNKAVYSGTATVTVENGTITTLYGGGLSAAVGSAAVIISGGTLTNVYGGGEEGAVTGNITVTVSGGSTTTLFGGCNAADVGGNITVQVTGGTITTLYGGNNASGTISGAIGVNISQDTSSTTSITTLYGGGNVAAYSGTATTSVSGGTIGTLYGGGLSASVGTAKVNISGGTLTDVYGGGYAGNIGTDTTASSTTVMVKGGSIGNVYGGGYNGSVYGTTTVSISDTTTTTTISGSVYGAGYGADTCVTNGTTVTVDLTYSYTATEEAVTETGTTASGQSTTTLTNQSGDSVISKDVYGGGNLGKVGDGNINTSTNSASISTAATTAVNIVSGHIKGNVYGGGYGVPTSGNYNIYMGTVFGSTDVNIGDSSSSKYIYIEGDIFGGGSQSRVYAVSGNTAATVDITSEGGSYIALKGSVFGGGERGSSATTNASVPTTIGNVSVNITGNSASTAATIYFVNGGVYGDGNLCLVSGTRTINITNLITGTGSSTLKTFYSLQRANTATLSNSKIVLLGATDLVAEGDSTTYSINRINELNLTNGSTIKLDQTVNYLAALTSDVYTERKFINGGYNGSNSYNTGATVSALTDTEISTYISAVANSTTITDTSDSNKSKYPNTVCVANGLSLELKTTDGGYGTVTGLFTLSLLREVAGEGGGFVYADITTSTGDFICTTLFGESYTQATDVNSSNFASGIYYTKDGSTYTLANSYSDGTTYYTKGEEKYMEVADDVGGYTSGAYTYYYWFIAGSTINYTMEVTGYIGSDVSDYEDSGTVTRHSDTRYYVLNSVSVGSSLATIVTGGTYTLATSSSLSGQQIAIEVKLGDDSLGFLYYDSTYGWGLYNNGSAKYGTANETSADSTPSGNNLTSSGITVTSSNDTIYFVLHKSSDAGTEISEMTLTITIEIYGDNNGIGDKVSGTTNKLVIAGTVNIARLGPSQAIYKTSGKNYAGVSEDSSICITAGSSFTVQYQTKYIPAAFSSTSGTMTWALSTQAYYYYYNSTYKTYMTLDSSGSCVNISSTLYYGSVGNTSGIEVRKDSDGYYYMPDYTTKVYFECTTFAASTIPSGTKITMIDLTGGSAEYYYYICSSTTTYIKLDDFCKMGTSTKISELSSYPAFMAAYYNTASANTLVSENLIFIFDFEDTTATGSFSVQLQHLYNSVDIMDYVKSPTEGDSLSTYVRYTPTLTTYTISTEAGYTLSATFGSSSYYDLDTATLTVTITEDATNINTRLSENEYAIKIELIVDSKAAAFPVGMEFKYNGVTYAIAAGGTYVIIPVKTSGTYIINITNELYSLKAITKTDSAAFKVTLYSAPDASYYNNIEWGSKTASYTIVDNPTYALSVTTSITVTDGEGNETVTTYSQVLTQSDTLRFWVKGTCDGSDTTVTVSLLKKDSNGDYVSATLSDLFTNSNDSITASSIAEECGWTISNTADAGTYRLVFTYGDCVEYLNVIVYSST